MNTDIVLLVVIGLQFAYIVYADWRNYLERQKLNDRLMSRDFTDYFNKELEKTNIVERTKRIKIDTENAQHIQL